jgi:hypothetical protein
MRFLAFLFLLLLSKTAAEKLSSGEDVSNFVVRHIQNFEVGKLFVLQFVTNASLA